MTGDCPPDSLPGHLGEDWNRGWGSTDVGECVHAIAAGEVVFAGSANGWLGAIVMVRHTAEPGEGFYLPHLGAAVPTVVSLYAHLDADSLRVGVSDTVTIGQVLGIIGNYPQPHLHWEVLVEDLATPGPGYSTDPAVLATRTWPTDFVVANRITPIHHADPIDLGFGTTDGNFILTTAEDGTVGLKVRRHTELYAGFTQVPEPLPAAGACLACTAGGHIFFFHDDLTTDGDLYVAAAGAVTEPGAWNLVPDQPPTLGMSIQQMCFAGGYLYLLGRGTTDKALAARVRHDGSLGGWFDPGPLPASRSGYRVLATGGHLYFSGGYDGSVPDNLVFGTVLEADGRFGGWASLSPMPSGKAYHGFAACEGHLFAVAGAWTTSTTNNVSYAAPINDDGTLGAWSAGEWYPYPRSSFPMLVIGDCLIALGGAAYDAHNGCGVTTGTAFRCLISAGGTMGPWESFGAAASRSDAAAVLVDNTILQLGGSSRQCFQSSVPQDDIHAGPLLDAGFLVASARFAHDFTVPITTSGLVLDWDADFAPSSEIRIRFRRSDLSTGQYGTWSDWSTDREIPIIGITDRIGYEIAATVGLNDELILDRVRLRYRSPILFGGALTGSEIPVPVGAGAMCVLDQVDVPGSTLLTPSAVPILPAGYDLIMGFDLSTSAGYGGLIKVALDTRGMVQAGTPLDLLHEKGGAWEVVTSLFDDANQMLFGWVTDLSRFAVATPVDLSPVPPEDTPGARIPLANYPNPFNPRTELRFTLPADDRVSLRVYDLAGRLVRSLLVHSDLPEGEHLVRWDGIDFRGRPAASGIYVYRLVTSRECQTGKMTLVR